jgi:predicted RNA methylase
MYPCTWEYVFNDVYYQYMTRDTVRNDAYQNAIHQTVSDKTVVEIGPGSMCFLTLMCVEAGARKIYAIEINEQAYRQAQALIQDKELTSKIELIYGSSDEVDLPEQADVCISEIIGCIGGTEGAATLQHNSKRFLKPGGIMVPGRCLTWVSPVYKPEIYHDAFVDEACSLLIEDAYQTVGKRFPFPYYAISNFPHANLIAPRQKFEDFDFNQDNLVPDSERNLTFAVSRDILFDGLAFWIELYVDPTTTIDAFSSKTSWETAYVPFTPFNVQQDDTIQVFARSQLGSHSFKPDYFFEVTVWRQSQCVYHDTRAITWA